VRGARSGLGLLGLAGTTFVALAWLATGAASATSTSVTPPLPGFSVSNPTGATGSSTQVTVPGSTPALTQPTSQPVAPAPLSPPAGSGADSLLSPPSIRHGNPPTFAERYGTSYFGLTQADASNSTTEDGALGAVTDAMWSVVMLLVGFAIIAVEWAFHLDLASVIAPSIQHITTTLESIVFDPWVAVVIVGGGAWLVWWGLVRRRASVAGEGALWMVVALVAAVAFLAQPTSLLVGADKATTAIGTSALSALGPVAPTQTSVDGAKTPSSAYANGPASDAELRRAADTLWETYVYEPWLVAEFGSISAGSTDGPAWLALQSHGGTVQAEQAALAATPGTATPGTATPGTATPGTATPGTATPGTATPGTATPGTAATAQGAPATAQGAPATAQAWFAGSYPSGRFGVVLVALIAALALCGLLGALALAVLLAQVAVILLVALAPVFLLLGVHPGYGRRLATRWAELAVAAVVKRVVYSVVLAVVLIVIGELVALMSAAGVGWAITALLPTLSMVALVLFRRKVSQALGAGAELARESLVRLQRSSPSPPRDAPVPRRLATHHPHQPHAGDGARPPWWVATRHPLGPASRSVTPSGAQPDGIHTHDHEPAAVP
jgi:hypothetical protein